MKKQFYEEPEIEVMTYGLANIITASAGAGSGNLGVEDTIPGDGDGDGDDFDWGGIY